MRTFTCRSTFLYAVYALYLEETNMYEYWDRTLLILMPLGVLVMS
jgi:hypothetical protein